jgi:hypothetical protein
MPSDPLVKLLNRYGYQAVFLPRTGMTPPDLYTYVKPSLKRRGPLSDYMDTAQLPVSKGSLSNFEGQQTGGKHFQAAADFLKAALQILGIGSVPKVDLKFAGASQFVFSFANVTYLSIDPSKIDKVLQNLKVPLAIPDDRVETGALHIAYEYAYSTTLRMSRADRQAFDVDVSGKIADFIDVGTGAKAESEANTVISFSTPDLQPAAFAYRAGRLHRSGRRWTFDPELVMRGSGSSSAAATGPSFIAAENQVLRVVDEPFHPLD